MTEQKKGFGHRSSNTEEELPEASSQSGDSRGDYYKFTAGSNMFFLLPPMLETTPRPFRGISVHQKPFHVCNKNAPTVGQKGGNIVKISDSRFSSCYRCENAWNRYGFVDKEDKDSWRESENYKKFRREASSDKVLFMAIPVNAFFTSKIKNVGGEKVCSISLKEDAKDLWKQFQANYPEFYRQFKEKAEGDPNHFEGLELVSEASEKSFKVGIYPIMFSFDVWYGTSGSTNPDNMMKHINQFSKGPKGPPWGIDDDGNMIAVVNIVSSDRTDHKAIRYSFHIVGLDESNALKFSPKFTNFMVENCPDVNDVFAPISNAQIRDLMKKQKEFSSDATPSNAPDCFGDVNVYDPAEDKCFECEFRAKCALKIRNSGAGNSENSDNDDEDEVEQKPKNNKNAFAKKASDNDDDDDDVPVSKKNRTVSRASDDDDDTPRRGSPLNNREAFSDDDDDDDSGFED